MDSGRYMDLGCKLLNYSICWTEIKKIQCLKNWIFLQKPVMVNSGERIMFNLCKDTLYDFLSLATIATMSILQSFLEFHLILCMMIL